MEQRPKKLLEQVQDVIRLKHYSYQTEKTYIYWIRRYILFHNKRHPKDIRKELQFSRWTRFSSWIYAPAVLDLLEDSNICQCLSK